MIHLLKFIFSRKFHPVYYEIWQSLNTPIKEILAPPFPAEP